MKLLLVFFAEADGFLRAVQGANQGAADFANCSACIFRGTNYCLDGYLRCTYLNEGTDEMMSVHWVGAETHANIALWTELTKFFEKNTKEKTRKISYDIMTAAVLKYKETAR